MLVALSILLAVILALRSKVVEYFSSRQAYQLWLAIPVCLLGAWLPNNAKTQLPVNQMPFYTVTNSEVMISNQQVLSDYLFIVYLIGLSAGLLALLYSGLMQRNVVHQSLNQVNHKLMDTVALPVYESEKVYSPALFGLIKPAILIPKAFFEQFTRSQQQAIIQHELYHHSRKDILWNLIAVSIVIVFWFHPMVWIGYRAFRQDQELSCDEAVLEDKSTTSKQDYARALIQIHSQSTAVPLQLYFGQQGNETMVKERLMNIKKTSRYSKLFTFIAAIFITVISTTQLKAEVSKKDKILSGEPAKMEQPIVRVNPTYPAEAADNGIEGWVILEFGVTPNGTVDNIRVIESHPDDVFDKEAKKALAKWRYMAKDRKQQVNTVQLSFKL
ncbi:M56 family metallopeptidase [Thalassotalea sediminis]|uniref:M56 family metallopeptidase n=1 Tax=Thalassotalea sediminis TaxID=1759089 RepID=UPI0025735338|nr:M56 family metallopeptidase [Thalassotalea sediminis]